MFMRKGLFLTLALVLSTAIGISAQSFNKTLTIPDGGVKVETSNQYSHKTDLISLSEATKTVRYTVYSNYNGELTNGYPVFALAELSVLDTDGNKIPYTVTSNADHNTVAGFNDGGGLAALNDGNTSNYFHSAWWNAPAEYHYLELTFETAISDFSLEWVSRENPKNRPTVVGLTPATVEFVPFQEWNFSANEKVSKLSDIDTNEFYTLYVEGPEQYVSAAGDTTAGRGNVHITLKSNSQDVGSYNEASPFSIMQLVPTGKEGVYVIYNSLNSLFFANSARWSNYNGANGWQYAYSTYTHLQEITFTERPDGDFELSYTVDEYYDGTGKYVGEETTFYIGYDMRGSLKIFEEAGKTALENGQYGQDYAAKFGLPVDFGFTLNKVSVADDVKIATISYDEILSEQLEGELTSVKSLVKSAQEVYDTYIEKIDPEYLEYGEDVDFLDAIAAAAADTLETASPDVETLKAHKSDINSTAVWFLYVMLDQLGITAYDLLQDGSIFCTYPDLVAGKYPDTSKEILEQVSATATDKTNGINNEMITTLSAAKTAVEEVEALMNSFYVTVINISSFPAMMDDVQGLPGTVTSGQYVWESPKVYISEPIEGIRVTFLDANTTDNYNGYKYVAFAEFGVKDNDGNPLALTESSFSTNSLATNDGTGLPALVDGQTGTYYHSYWGGGTYDPVTYVYFDILFPTELDIFSINYISRNQRTTPTKIAITAYGEAYDPLLFAPNPYNVGVNECTQITSVDQITDEGIYAIRGLLNTNSEIIADSLLAKEYWYSDVTHYHTSVLNSEVPFFINKTDDGKYTIQSLYTAKYWPSVVADLDSATLADDVTGFVASTPYKNKAAKVSIVPATSGIEGSFVIYEESDRLYAEVQEVDMLGDTSTVNINTPYAVYMDWYSGLAVRPVIDPQPWGGTTGDVQDAWGDSLHFNKNNGEGQWKIYKISMDTPYTFWLGNLVNAMSGIAYRTGDDPGCVNVDGLSTALAEAQAVVADTVSAADVKEVNAKTAGLALVAAYDAVASAERKPMVPGTYMIVSAYNEYYKQQGVEKAIYENANGGISWNNAPAVSEAGATDGAYCFEFIASPYREDYVMNGLFSEEDAANIYIIKNVATGKYVGGADAVSTGFSTVDEAEAVGYMVTEAAGSSFLIRNIAGSGWNMHTGGHGAGASQSGSIVYWGTTEGASTWYLQSVTMDETSIGDLTVEGDEVVSVSYYTVGGAATDAPVKGINIVKIVYANGAVETKKVIVE